MRGSSPALLTILLAAAASVPAVEFRHCFDVDPRLIALRLDAAAGIPGDGYLFLDTGASFICLDQSCARLLTGDAGKPFDAHLSHGSASFRLLRTAPFSVEGYAIPGGLDGTLLDCAKLKEASGLDFVGLLGYPALAGKVLDIDPDAGAVRLLDRVADGVDLSTYAVWPFRVDSGLVHVHVVIGGVTVSAEVDTGSNGFIDLALSDFEALERNGAVVRNRLPATTAVPGSIVASPQGEAHGLLIDRFTFPACTVDTSDCALIGMDFIRNFRFIVDYPHSTIYLKPNRAFATYRPRIVTGAHLHFIGETVRLSVDAGSDAYACGLRDGFTLLEIRGQPARALGFSKGRTMLEDYLREPVELTVLDGDGHRRAVMLKKP